MLGVVSVFGTLFVLNSFTIHEGDYFWHVNTGQWIWEHWAIPVSDPFSFTVTDHNPFRPESGRPHFILQQYWLSQLVLYFLWECGGDASIVVLRALIHAGLITSVFFVTLRRSDFCRALIFATLTFCYFQVISNERPQLFTVLFVYLLILFLERVTARGRSIPRVLFVGLPVMMLLWANMHGGYLLGLCIIGAYSVGYYLEQRKAFDWNSGKRILLMLGSGLAAMINPAGLPELLTELFAMPTVYQSQIRESVSSIKAILATGVMRNLTYVIMVLLIITSMVTAFKRMRLTHLLLIGGLLILSFMAVRHQVFLFLLAPLVAIYLPFPKKKWAIPITSILLLFLVSNTNIQEPLVFAAKSPIFPVDAADFIRNTRPATNIFNYQDWGGYLVNKDPDFKVFVDGRALAEELVTEHNEIVYLENLSGLDTYQINTAIFPIHNLVTGNVVPLAVMLMYDPDWEAVFLGTNSLVFLRKIPENNAIIRSSAVQRSSLVKALINAYEQMLVWYPTHYRALVTRAQLQENIGDLDGAMGSLRKAQVVNPESLYVKESLQRLMRKTVRPGSG
jgi:hypothetical protein